MFAGFAHVGLLGVAIAEFLPADESGRRQGRACRHKHAVEFLHVVFLFLPGRCQFHAVVSQLVCRGKEFAKRSWVPAGTMQADLHGLEVPCRHFGQRPMREPGQPRMLAKWSKLPYRRA